MTSTIVCGSRHFSFFGILSYNWETGSNNFMLKMVTRAVGYICITAAGCPHVRRLYSRTRPSPSERMGLRENVWFDPLSLDTTTGIEDQYQQLRSENGTQRACFKACVLWAQKGSNPNTIHSFISFENFLFSFPFSFPHSFIYLSLLSNQKSTPVRTRHMCLRKLAL